MQIFTTKSGSSSLVHLLRSDYQTIFFSNFLFSIFIELYQNILILIKIVEKLYNFIRTEQ